MKLLKIIFVDNYKILRLKRNYGNHKSHGVQINTDHRKTLIWNKTLPWELFEARTATERFFHRGQNIVKVENPSMGALRHVCENINQELLQKGFSLWTKNSKSIKTHI